LRNLFKRKKASRYPEEESGILGARLPQLALDEQGRVRCVACYLCSSACPAGCISIEADEAPREDRLRFPRVFEIDAMRCIFCGYCILACPVDALVMDRRRPLATADRRLL
jgi:NADH-quinone oxidoreductase subunit I